MYIIGTLCVLFAYFLGAVPFGLVLTRGSGIDIRNEGSRNIGATNVARLLGKKMGALTLLCDLLKGFAPMFVAALLVGDGPLRAEALALLDTAGVADLAWLPGERHDVPDVLRGLDCFVLPSLAEGISNTILEAMASGLPVIATRVGGNPELVIEGKTGALVPASDPEAMAQAIIAYVRDPEQARVAGQAGRTEVERRFSMAAMMESYRGLYDQSLRIDRI